MSDRSCLHPKCPHTMRRGQNLCRRHFAQLPAEIRDRLIALGKERLPVIDRDREEIEAVFAARMIGPHEAVPCRGSACGALIVWFKTRSGKSVPVNVEDVSAEDEVFNHQKHTAHFTTCASVGEFRK